jgi:hypothetical protein
MQPRRYLAIKHLSLNDRAMLLTWLLRYYRDDGAMFSPKMGRRRDRLR